MEQLIHYGIHTADNYIGFVGTGYYYDNSEDTWRFVGLGDTELVVSGREFRWMQNGPAVVEKPAQSE